MKKRLRLKSTMSIFYILAVVIPLLVISFISMSIAKSYFDDYSEDYNEQIIHNLKIHIESFFKEPQKELNTLKELLLMDETIDRETLISTFYDSQSIFHHIMIIEEGGRVKYDWPDGNKTGEDYSQKVTVKELNEGSESAWSHTYIDNREDFLSVNYAVKVGDSVLLGVIHMDSLKYQTYEGVNEGVVVGVVDEILTYVLHTDYSKVEQRAKDPFINKQTLNNTLVTLDGKDYYATSIDTDYRDWKIVIYEPTEIRQKRIIEFMLYLGMIIVMSMIFVTLVGYQFNKMIFRNLNRVVKKTQEVRDGKYALKSEKESFVEFHEISQNFSAMVYEIKSREDQILAQNYEIETMNKELENRVIERTDELFSANQELEITLENLKMTQDQLVESEKLASLGDLVAGLAHEINTPLGIILTITTYMQESTKQVKEIYDTGMLKKSDFEQHLIATADSEALVYENITRAIELISSFKLISAEQRNMEKREVDLKEFMDSILKSVEPKLKKAKIEVNLHIKEDIKITTIPISLYQIIVNLVMNAHTHAYHNTDGVVDIYINLEYHGIEIIVQDYGTGISGEHIKRIFDPFFTTKRGSGGTGLGLNIVYNTVKQNLKGEIRCFSEVGVGTQFIIHLPLSL